MIAREALIADFQTMLRDRWGYIPATAGEMWTREKQNKATSEMVRKYGRQWVGHRVADCSGAFVWAYRQHGLSIYHGSNRIARKYVKELLPIAQARPGMAAFKARRPGEQQYDLPAEYRQGGQYYTGDLNDYYHIGLIDTDPRYVLNSRSTASGFVRSKLADGWDCCGCLKAVTYEGSDEPVQEILYQATVVSSNGKPVNLRAAPSKQAQIMARIPVGTLAEVLNEYDETWAEICCNGRAGYMMREFLERNQEQPGPDIQAVLQLLEEAEQHIQAAREKLNGML